MKALKSKFVKSHSNLIYKYQINLSDKRDKFRSEFNVLCCTIKREINFGKESASKS